MTMVVPPSPSLNRLPMRSRKLLPDQQAVRQTHLVAQLGKSADQISRRPVNESSAVDGSGRSAYIM